MTRDGVDLLTVVLHELGHLLGYGHSDEAADLMAPVLAVGRSAAAPSITRPSFSVLPASGFRAPASLPGLPSSSAADELLADLFQDDGQDLASELSATSAAQTGAAQTQSVTNNAQGTTSERTFDPADAGVTTASSALVFSVALRMA